MDEKEYELLREKFIRELEQMEQDNELYTKIHDYIIPELERLLKELLLNLESSLQLLKKIKNMNYLAELFIKINKNISKNQNVKYYKESSQYFKDNNIDFYEIIYERIYVENYQYFEFFIADTLKVFYTALPNMLLDFKDKKYNNIYVDSNEDIKKHIEIKVQKTIRDNICKVLKKFQTIFDMSNSYICEEDIQNLFIISQNRNILVHNKGVVNITYINNLKKESIETNYELEDKINIAKDEHIITQNSLMNRISSSLIKNTIKELEKILANSKKRVK